MENKEEKSNLRTPAIPGTAWVQSKSKTYNHVYYFNTKTGETVWDLSHAEFEKAQKTIQNVISKPKMTNDGCPEPKLPPKEPPNCDQRQYFEQKTTPSKIYNKQIINNRFTRQPYPITTVLAPNCSHAMPPSSLAIPGPSSTIMSIPDNTSNTGILPLNDTGYSDIDSGWLEDNLIAEGNKLRLDVTSLKMLASSVSNTHCWYIAVDKTILLRHLHFLIVLYNSDEDCRLMVPRVVLDELRAEAKNKSIQRASRRARRAVMFITEQKDSAVAIIGTEVCEDSDIEIPHVLNCCIKLVEQSYHVVLISNDTELQRYKNNLSVPIFSIVELMDFISQRRL